MKRIGFNTPSHPYPPQLHSPLLQHIFQNLKNLLSLNARPKLVRFSFDSYPILVRRKFDSFPTIDRSLSDARSPLVSLPFDSKYM